MNTTSNTLPTNTDCTIHNLVGASIIPTNSYDFLSIRSNDGKVFRCHADMVCEECVCKIVNSSRNE